VLPRQSPRSIFCEVVVDPHERRRIVVETFIRRERRRERKPEALDEIEEPADRVWIGAKPLEGEWICGQQREKRIGATREGERSEREELVLHDWAARSEADLVLRVLLTERRIGIVDELETRIAERITERALDVVGASLRRRRDLSARELPTRDIISIRYDARVAHRL